MKKHRQGGDSSVGWGEQEEFDVLGSIQVKTVTAVCLFATTSGGISPWLFQKDVKSSLCSRAVKDSMLQTTAPKLSLISLTSQQRHSAWPNKQPVLKLEIKVNKTKV